MIDDVFAVIADPTRRQILRVLSSGKRPVGDLVNELGVSQPTVSKHLKVLRTAGLVETQAVGQKRFYSLTPEPLTQISAWVESLNQALEQTANSPLSAEETPASHQPQQQEESYPQPQEVLEPAVATFNLGQEGGSTAPGQPRHSQRAIAFTPLKPFVPKIAAAEMTVESEQVTASEQIVEEPAVTNDAVETT
ncbi:MAG: metalloregulator ArsR/SmtB family transcription factor, partial [Rothia sp. (in: high G+C Gram-positive bacteria)]|nr:metalloregulator ArsR/SmtB family transcription factor [Rothia sp. (in: high G+C Gram-positive bacteria)]